MCHDAFLTDAEHCRFPFSSLPRAGWPEGIAILMVVAYHYNLAPFLSGVDLFFVLSGFLLGGILLDKEE
ncbi:MAG: hypothetical protein M3315_13990, partial [Actinomycetota bacterium]|nr:hypothetical protein [Actinomycetota bacterium]